MALDIQIASAMRHCKRALYDAHEIGIVYHLESIRAFEEKHASDSDLVLEVVPDYPDLLAHAADASDLLSQVKPGKASSPGAPLIPPAGP